MTLFARTTREVNLTKDGEEFLFYCKAIIQEVENLENFLSHKNDLEGVLKIALPPYFSRYHIVPYLKEFCELYPSLKLDIFLTENPVSIIEEDYDLQVRIQIPEDENLKVAKLMTNQKVLCASKEYVAKFGEPKTPQDLLNHKCIIFAENKVWEFRNLKTKKVTHLRKMAGNITCNNGEIIKELILQGDGITVKSVRDIENEIKSGQIIVLLQDYEIVHKTSFYAVYPTKKQQPPKIKAFIEFFQNKLREE